MTTFFNFQPTQNSNFEFQPTLDGSPYRALVPWLLFGQRWYLSLYSLNGTLVFNKALVGSPNGVAIESLSWANGFVLVTTKIPHGYRLGQTVQLTIDGCSPDEYNGTPNCLIVNDSQLSYPLAGNPGPATSFGNATFNVNLVQGYFVESTLVYRSANKQFEVSP